MSFNTVLLSLQVKYFPGSRILNVLKEVSSPVLVQNIQTLAKLSSLILKLEIFVLIIAFISDEK